MFNIFKKKQEPKTEIKEVTYHAFGAGKLVPLEDVPDQVFAQRMMGDGYAIELTENTIVSPVDGEVILVFPTGHAFGLKTEDGVEILLHLGIDTVELNGEGFVGQVKQGDKVKAGDVLTIMDLEKIRAAGKLVVSPLIFTSGQQIELKKANQDIVSGETDLFEFK
ncbi:MAG TPA: PTS glucose transporter subunit IIA [Erysipelothrix sp.]|nr:PTS glucose transporter subunit IIA [Erysipelothrix sp.]